MHNPELPFTPEQIEERLKQYEEEYAIETYPSEHRNHLGASSIADECWRKLWSSFRWLKLGQPEGRMRRLWNRGHREEAQFQEFLLWAGFSQRNFAEVEGKQNKFSKLDGHYGGSTDDLWLIRWANDYPIIAEYKTFADKYFQELKKKKLKLSNPKYYGQMCSYGREWQVEYGLFYATNKDNDELYREFVKLDWNYAVELEKKAGDIINAKIPPNKISEQASFWKCKSCTFYGICHFGERVEKNCRSCKFASPSINASWVCSKHGIIPKDFIPQGCGEWEGII